MVTFIINPILDNSFTGARNLDFAPATRLAVSLSSHWTVAAEEYADFGSLHDFYPSSEQSHVLFGVIDYSASRISVELGLGAGLTSASDHRIAKLIFSADL